MHSSKKYIYTIYIYNMLQNFTSKVKHLSVKYLKAHKFRVDDYIKIENSKSSSCSSDDVMFLADNHGNVKIANSLSAKNVYAKSLTNISEKFYLPSTYTASATLTSNDVLDIKHIVVTPSTPSVATNLTLPSATQLLTVATSLLCRTPCVPTSSQRGDWFIFTITNNSPDIYCGTSADVTLVAGSGVTITGAANGLDSLCSGGAHFGLYFTNVSSTNAAVTILRLSGQSD
jgi:hypothetical protein